MGQVELALVGVGSLRYGAPVLLSIAHLQPSQEWSIRVFDTDLERLDLMDRLARMLLIDDNVGPRIVATDECDDASAGANLGIVMLGGNTALRFWNPAPRLDRSSGTSLPSATPVSLEAWFESRVEEAPVVVSARQGDPIDRKARIQELWSHCRLALPPNAAILNLTAELEGQIEGTHELLWPPPLTQKQRQAVPHQILRWIRGEDRIEPDVDAMKGSPVVTWLQGHVEPLT